MINVLVADRVYIPLSDLDAELVSEICKIFTHPNPARAEWFKYRRGKGRPPSESIGTWRRRSGALDVPRGGLGKVLELFEARDLKVNLFDERSDGVKVDFGVPNLEPWSFQTRLINAALESDLCLWRSPAASGKTIAAMHLAGRYGRSTLVIVPTRGIFDQWVERARALLGVRPGRIQGKTRDVRTLTIAMQQSLVDRVDDVVNRAFGLVIADEVQLFAAKTFQQVIDKLRARKRVGVSNDERRADEREFLIYDQFGSNVVQVDRAELIRSGHIVEVEVRVVPTQFRADWYRHAPPEEKFKRYGDLLDAMAKDRDRNELIRTVVKSCLLEGEQAIVLTHRREHCLVLDSLLAQDAATGRLVGDDSPGEFERCRAGLASGEVRAAVGTYQAVGVGFEAHRRLARGVFATPVAADAKGRMQFEQYLGRFARADRESGKSKAIVFYLFDVQVFGVKPVRLMKSWGCNVTVLEQERWISASEWLKHQGGYAETKRSERDDNLDGLFQ